MSDKQRALYLGGWKWGVVLNVVGKPTDAAIGKVFVIAGANAGTVGKSRHNMTAELPLESAEGTMFTSDGKSITCNQCNMTSHHPCDVKYKYCNNCHIFLDIFDMPTREEFGKIYCYHKWVAFWDRVKRVLFFWRRADERD